MKTACVQHVMQVTKFSKELVDGQQHRLQSLNMDAKPLLTTNVQKHYQVLNVIHLVTAAK